MPLLLAEIALTNIIFSFALYLFFVRIDVNKSHSHAELLLYCLGLGPAFTTLLLYYFFLTLPRNSNILYLLLVIITYAAVALPGIREFPGSLKRLGSAFENTIGKFRGLAALGEVKIILCSAIIFVPLCILLFSYFKNALHSPILDQDMLGYGTMGNILFHEKSLQPIWIENFSPNGFLYKTVHAPSFSLLLTWEKIVEVFFGTDSDMYFKSISMYYGILIAVVQFYWLSKRSWYLALLGLAALFSGLAFVVSVIHLHLDTYRIFFLTVSWIYLAYTIRKRDLLSYILFGIFSGLAAFAHSIGMIMTAINCLVLFVFADEGFRERLLKTGMVVFLVMVFGGLHFILDIFIGRGWLLKWH